MKSSKPTTVLSMFNFHLFGIALFAIFELSTLANGTCGTRDNPFLREFTRFRNTRCFPQPIQDEIAAGAYTLHENEYIVHRFFVHPNQKGWDVVSPYYQPPWYTQANLLGDKKPDWADPIINKCNEALFEKIWNKEADPVKDPCERLSVDGSRYLVIPGRRPPNIKSPHNPEGRKGVEGKGQLGREGINEAADLVFTRSDPYIKRVLRMTKLVARYYQAAIIRRKDNGEHGTTGGMRNYPEPITKTALREGVEESMDSIGKKKRYDLVKPVLPILRKRKNYPTSPALTKDESRTIQEFINLINAERNSNDKLQRQLEMALKINANTEVQIGSGKIGALDVGAYQDFKTLRKFASKMSLAVDIELATAEYKLISKYPGEVISNVVSTQNGLQDFISRIKTETLPTVAENIVLNAFLDEKPSRFEIWIIRLMLSSSNSQDVRQALKLLGSPTIKPLLETYLEALKECINNVDEIREQKKPNKEKAELAVDFIEGVGALRQPSEIDSIENLLKFQGILTDMKPLPEPKAARKAFLSFKERFTDGKFKIGSPLPILPDVQESEDIQNYLEKLHENVFGRIIELVYHEGNANIMPEIMRKTQTAGLIQILDNIYAATEFLKRLPLLKHLTEDKRAAFVEQAAKEFNHSKMNETFKDVLGFNVDMTNWDAEQFCRLVDEQNIAEYEKRAKSAVDNVQSIYDELLRRTYELIEIQKGKVKDKRETDHAWMVSTCEMLKLDDVLAAWITMNMQAGDDAVEVKWKNLVKGLPMFASHTEYLDKIYDHYEAKDFQPLEL